MSVLKFVWFSTDIVLAMSVALSLGITSVHSSLSSTGTMVSKRVRSKDIVESATGDAVEQVSMSLLIYKDTELFIAKEIKMKWQDINYTFLGTFQENLENRRDYVNMHKFGLYQIACWYLVFPCTNMIH